MSKALFLSYAREDAAAVQRVADALKAAGIEVWFDTEELRGGDAWDQVIRRHIRDCRLFLPVISRQTEHRHEGYFRREWRMAVERTRDMSESLPFLVPILIDDLNEAGADVPEAFRRVHWTRLPGGETDATFVAHVKDLLEGAHHPTRDSARTPSAGHGVPPPVRPPARSRRARIAVLAAAVGAALITVFWLTRPTTNTPPAEADASPPFPQGGIASDHSIAVLPFANLSADADNAYFAAGMHEDLQTQLTAISGLQVAAPAAASRHDAEAEDVQAIGRELHVHYVLQGSVRRAGDEVRVSVQLTDTGRGMNLWAQTFDRQLDNIFVLQSEISREIAAQLQVTLSPEDAAGIDRIPTTNIAAYDDYLKARATVTSTWDKMDLLHQGIALLESATRADPKFIEAWSLLSQYHSIRALRLEITDDEASAEAGALARQTLRKAEALNPRHVATYQAEGYYHMMVDHDFMAAAGAIDRATTLVPNDSDNLLLLGYAYRQTGQPAKAIATLEKAHHLDPANAQVVGALRADYSDTGDYRKLLDLYNQLLAADPERVDYAIRAKFCEFLLKGSLASFKAYEAALSSMTQNARCDPSAWQSGFMTVAMINHQVDDYDKDWRERWERHFHSEHDRVCPVLLNDQAEHAALLIREGRKAEGEALVQKSLQDIGGPLGTGMSCQFDTDMIRPKLAFLSGDSAKAKTELADAIAKCATKPDGYKKYLEKEVLLEAASMIDPERAVAIYREIQRDPLRLATFETICANPWNFEGLLGTPEFQKEVRRDGRFVGFLTTYGFLKGAVPATAKT